MHHHPFHYLYPPEGTVTFFICLFGGQAALDCLSLMLLAMTNVSELIMVQRHHCLHLLCVLLQSMYLHQPLSPYLNYWCMYLHQPLSLNPNSWCMYLHQPLSLNPNSWCMYLHQPLFPNPNYWCMYLHQPLFPNPNYWCMYLHQPLSPYLNYWCMYLHQPLSPNPNYQCTVTRYVSASTSVPLPKLPMYVPAMLQCMYKKIKIKCWGDNLKLEHINVT